MPYDFPEAGPAGGGSGGAYSGYGPSPMNRGGLLFELGYGGAGGGTGSPGYPTSPRGPTPQPPPFGIGFGRGGAGAVPGSWGFSDGTPDAYAGGDPWQAEIRRRYGWAQPTVQRGGGGSQGPRQEPQGPQGPQGPAAPPAYGNPYLPPVLGRDSGDAGSAGYYGGMPYIPGDPRMTGDRKSVV